MGEPVALRRRRCFVDDQSQDEAQEPLGETGSDDDRQGEDGGENGDFHFTPIYRRSARRLKGSRIVFFMNEEKK